MVSFKQFLAENLSDIEKETFSTENETIIHVNNNGEVVVENDIDESNDDEFDTFYSDE